MQLQSQHSASLGRIRKNFPWKTPLIKWWATVEHLIALEKGKHSPRIEAVDCRYPRARRWIENVFVLWSYLKSKTSCWRRQMDLKMHHILHYPNFRLTSSLVHFFCYFAVCRCWQFQTGPTLVVFSSRCAVALLEAATHSADLAGKRAMSGCERCQIAKIKHFDLMCLFKNLSHSHLGPSFFHRPVRPLQSEVRIRPRCLVAM